MDFFKNLVSSEPKTAADADEEVEKANAEVLKKKTELDAAVTKSKEAAQLAAKLKEQEKEKVPIATGTESATTGTETGSTSVIDPTQKGGKRSRRRRGRKTKRSRRSRRHR